jgi:hypothetical protein
MSKYNHNFCLFFLNVIAETKPLIHFLFSVELDIPNKFLKKRTV